MLFPTMVVDNFFSDPFRVIHELETLKLMDSKEYESEISKAPECWPGYRSVHLHRVNPELNTLIIRKILSSIYGRQVGMSVESAISCHLRTKEMYPHHEHGFIHNDGYTNSFNLAGIVYLSADGDRDSGTSLFRPRPIGVDPSFLIPTEERIKYYNNEIDNLPEFIQKKKEHENEWFEETMEVKNVFNRLLLYDTHQYHRANALFLPKPRLTLTIFLSINYNSFPIPLMQTI